MRGEFEFNLHSKKGGRTVPRTTPPLEADASNLHGSFRQTLRYSTTSESAAQGNQQTGGRVVCTNRGVISTTQGIRWDLQILVLQHGPGSAFYQEGRHKRVTVPRETEHGNDQHPKGMLTTHALFAWKK